MIKNIRTRSAPQNRKPFSGFVMRSRILVAAALLVLNAPGGASTVYSYVGNVFDTFRNDEPIPTGSYDTSIKVTGTNEFAASVAANTSSIS